MQRCWVLLLLLSLVFPAVTACNPLQAAAEKQLTLLGITDFHGALEPKIIKTASGEEARSGGAGLLSSYIKIVRQKAKGPVVLLDAGDMYQGSLVSNSAEGEPVIRFYNYLGVDAAALGNHEFDYGPVGPDSEPVQEGQDPRGALKLRAKQASFPFLAVNTFTSSGEQPSWVRSSKLIERQGVKVGIVGAAYEQTPSTTNKANLPGLKFLSPATLLVAEAVKLRQLGADFVVLTAHIGGGCRDNQISKLNDRSSCDVLDTFELLDAMPSGTFDVMLGGHTHQVTNKYYRGTALVQPAAHGAMLAWADLKKKRGVVQVTQRMFEVCDRGVVRQGRVSCQRHALKEHKGKLVRSQFLGQSIRSDRRVAKMFKEDFQRVAAILARPLGAVAVDSFERGYFDESTMGNFTADTMAAAARRQGVKFDVTMMNNGGVREDLPKGPINFGHIYNAFIFDNAVVSVEVSGKTLKEIAAWGLARQRSGISWSGLRVKADKCNIVSVQVNGKPVNDKKMYTIITIDYLANGGSGFERFNITKDRIKAIGGDGYLRHFIAAELEASKGQLNPKDYFDPQKPRLVVERLCE